MHCYSGYSVYWSAIIWCTSPTLIILRNSDRMDTPIVASKIEEPVVATKVEEVPEVQTAAEHHASVIQNLNDGNTQAAFNALMTNHATGARMDYAESRMMYG